MAGHLSMKMKRKDLEEVYDEFSDFSLFSPARKIRRLDAELPPILEEEEQKIPLVFDRPLPEEGLTSTMEQVGAPVEDVNSVPLNAERALVLYKPVNEPLLQCSGSSEFSIMVNPYLISGFKNQVMWSGHPNPIKTMEDEAASAEQNVVATNDHLAVVPWVPSQLPPAFGMEALATGMSEPMEAEEVEPASMEIEDNNIFAAEGQSREASGMGGSEGLQHWQQQHCMIPQLPPNTSTPITWSW
ncbi:hypothetical protein HHK36_021018 [Tetracentron sinense]|uniref:Uncharacterized protein n=1 Tax=Tetracentron sinense TaxID=13715 RepID=A0A834YW59_TETSI|nr:hypothetical protein HHK36_021018 [Tetracentron sinense]